MQFYDYDERYLMLTGDKFRLRLDPVSTHLFEMHYLSLLSVPGFNRTTCLICYSWLNDRKLLHY
jgi:hypothetical protein